MIRFSGNIEFRNGSKVKVFGNYGLSITNQNGHILIETDINMTCTEMVLDESCLGGFTQSSVEQLTDPYNELFIFKGNRSCFICISHICIWFGLAFTLSLSGRSGYKA